MKMQNHPKDAARARFKTHLQYEGGLDEAERNELTAFEFDKGPVGLPEQIRRYCLQIKSRQGERWRVMVSEMESFGDLSGLECSCGLSQEGIATIESVCQTLDRYVTGFTLSYGWHFFSYSRVATESWQRSEIRTLHMDWIPFKESALVIEDVKIRFEGVVFADLWPETIAEQICRIYSNIKSYSSNRAKSFAIEVGEIPSMGVRSEEDDPTEDDIEHIRTLCEIIHEYHPKFILFYGRFEFGISDAPQDSELEPQFTVNGKPYSK